MHYQTLGRTGVRVSALAFGAGPVSGWMAELTAVEQAAVVQRALEAGINWFDTAAGYGEGQSERCLGAALARLGRPAGVHVATKVRYLPEHLADVRQHTRASFQGSLARLGLERVTLLQLHNAITPRRGDAPTSLTPADVLGHGGVLEAFEELRREGRVDHLGLTGIGPAETMAEVVRSGAFATLQVPFNALNPSAGYLLSGAFGGANYGNIISTCAAAGMGVFAIRVFAGGALAGRPPSAHTLKTPFFPLALYERDQRQAARLAELAGPGHRLSADALRFVMGQPQVASAIIGFREASDIDAAVRALECGPLPPSLQDAFLQAAAEAAEAEQE